MIEKVFKEKWCIQKHLDAPMLKERESFLEMVSHCGVKMHHVGRVANVLLLIVERLKITEGVQIKYSLNDVQDALLSCTRKPLPDNTFVCVAVDWLSSIGRMEDTFVDQQFIINRLFTSTRIRIRYHSLPLLKERASYLDHCAQTGMAPYTLQDIAINQLYAIELLHLEKPRTIMEEELQDAAERWMKSNKNGRASKCVANYRVVKRNFLTSIRNWIAYMGWYVRPQEDYPQKEKVQDYLHWMEEEKGCSQITIQGRLSLLRHFMKTMRPVKMDSITPQTIDEYLAIRKEKDGYSRRSISFVCTTLRSFFRYGASKGWNCEGLVASIKSPRIYHNEDLPSFTPWGTIQGILSGKSHGNGIAIRDYAVLLLLSVYGMRVSEVTGLKLKDLDWHNEQIYLRRAKGCRPQVFPILPVVGDAIIKYIKQFRYNENHCEYVFLRSFAPYGKLSNAAVYRLVCRELKATGVKLRHYGPHSLRHGRATQLINSGHSLKEIADILGHVRLNTTSIYAKVNLTSLRGVAEMNWEGLV